MRKILIGDTVKDIHTGFIGVVMCRSEFFNRCVQFDVVPKVDKDNKVPESQGIDEGSLVRVKKGPRHIAEEPIKKANGGPTNKGRLMRGY